jgi:uncharacterized membrane protein
MTTADDTPMERLNAEVERQVLAAKMARTPQTPVPARPNTLEEEYAAQREAGLHRSDDTPPAEPARPSTVNRDIANHLTEVIGRILSAE